MKNKKNFYEINGKSYDNPGLDHSIDNLNLKSSECEQQENSLDFIYVDEPGNDDNEKKSVIGTAVKYGSERLKKMCTKKTLYKRLPILKWLPVYNGADAVGDIVAGITVGITIIPQSLAYSTVAGLPPQYGLYGSFLGSFIYIFFGSCKDCPFGPTAIVSLLTYQTVSHLESPLEHAILLCLLSGIIELIMGILGLGFLIDFVSGPVNSGFTSAVALIILTSQIKDILGISAQGSTFIKIWKSISESIRETSFSDTILGISCIVFLLTLRYISSIKIGPTDPKLRTKRHKLLTKIIWLVGTSRNAILVIICGFLGYYFIEGSPFRLVGVLPSGMPQVKWPPFSYVKSDNTSGSFIDMCSNLGSGLIVVPLISLMEDVSICKAFSNGKSVDATQELFAIGIANIGNSFFQGFPGTGSLSRSAVNNASGVRTPLGGLYTSILVILALLFFTPYFYYIPKACLSAIIISAVIFMVEVKVIKPMWRSKRSDLIPGLTTFISCLLLQLEIGILIGVGINIIIILYYAARPKISVEKLTSFKGVDYLILTPDRCLIFPSVDYVRNLVTKYSRCSDTSAMPIVIDCSHIYCADFTAAKVIESLTKDFAAREQPLFFYNLKPSVFSVFDNIESNNFIVYYTEEALDDLLEEKGYLNKNIKLNLSIV